MEVRKEVEMLKNIGYHIHMLIEFIVASIKGMMEYRVDFMVGTISQIITQLLELIFIFIIFRVTGNIGEWNIYHILLIYGILNIAIGISDFLVDEVYSLGEKYLKQGLIDMLLLRPVHPIISMMGNSKSITAIGYLLIGYIITFYSMIKLSISISVVSVGFIIGITLIGGLIIAAVLVIVGVTGFWSYASNEIMWPFFRLTKFVQYPISIYSSVLKVILIVIIPYAFVSYYPSLMLLEDRLGKLVFLSPVIAMILWCMAFKIWSALLRFYKGTGT